MKLYKNSIIGLILGWVIVGLSSCYTRKISPTRVNLPNTAPLKPVNSLAKNSEMENLLPTKPRQGNTQYLNYVLSYIQTYSPIAVEEMKQYGVPASIILAQGIHESGAGKSNLALQANNHFGVKCTSDWSGPGFYMDDDKPQECFRKYSSPLESFQDHMAFLQRRRYANLYALGSQDYKGWAYGLKNCGYATNPNYPQILIGLIQKYNLQEFDMPSLSVSGQVTKEGPVKTLTGMEKSDGLVVNDTIHKKVYKIDTVYSIAYVNGPSPKSRDWVQDHPNTIPQNNLIDSTTNKTSLGQKNPVKPFNTNVSDSEYYTVRQGDTLYGISRRFNLSPEQLKSINNLPDSSIKIDQVLRIKP
jgi:flagellum-specific peptidoglycan hydrolase FlgJ